MIKALAARRGLYLEIPVLFPTRIIAERNHFGAVGTDFMQQIGQPDICAIFLDQCRLSVLAGSAALPALEPHQGGGVLGKA